MSPSWPSHAYVPGQSARHPEGAFDAVRDTARVGMSTEALAVCAAFVTGSAYLERGYFWEAHELLEPVWMACPQNSAEQVFVRGLIQRANARLKEKMGQPRAAARLHAMAQDLFAEAERRAGPILMGCVVRDQ